MANRAFKMVDADAHYYEPDDAFTRHIEAEFKDRTFRVDRSRPDGLGVPWVGDERSTFLSVAAGDHVGPPGLLKKYFSKGEFALPNAEPLRGIEEPLFTDQTARLSWMETSDVEATIMLPTTGVGVEHQLRSMPDLLYPSVRAFNRWIEDDWGFGATGPGAGKIFSSALLSLANVEQGCAELDRVIEAGAKVVTLTPGPPIDGHSPADPIFDPFWARCQEAQISVAFHIGSSNFNEMYGVHWGETPHPPSHRQSALQMYLGFGERPVADTLTAMCFHNLFGRFPDLRILSIENGASWVPTLVKRLERTHKAAVNKDSWSYGTPPTPSESFSKNIFVAPFFEDDVPPIVEVVGASQVLAGSDWPHPEGLSDPWEFADELEGLPADQIEMIMRGNTAALLGI